VRGSTKSLTDVDRGRVGRRRGRPSMQSDAIVTVLIVEDDQSMQGMVEAALTEGGFESTIAATGEEAVQVLQNQADKFHALVADVDLRGTVTGWDVARSARELAPDIPVIYTSRVAADQWSSQGVPNSVLLNKPFAPAQLVTAVSQLLNQTLPPTCSSRRTARPHDAPNVVAVLRFLPGTSMPDEQAHR
jgi:DNA-binding response OmpR family regulator